MHKDSEGAHFVSTRSGLIKWLDAFFGGSFVGPAQILPIGKQEDTYSCGISVINAMDHAVSKAPLFTHETRNQHRISYFMHILQVILNAVRETIVF